MPTTAEDNEKKPTLINLSKAIIRPDWLVEGSTAWVKCPRCGEKRPLNFIKSTGKCPACGAIAVDIPKEETPVSSAAAESEEIVPTAKSRNPFINPDWLIEGSTTWVKCPQCGQKRPMDFIRATGKCPACGASALNKQSD